MKRIFWFLFIAGLVIFSGVKWAEGKDSKRVSGGVPNLVTSDIQAGIENHIDEKMKQGRGYFNLSFGKSELNLKLVRVHTEYLANLGPRRHFACVDLVDLKGDVYDVDFFLSGDPGMMIVTETTVHKINGQPFYAWAQEKDGTWKRVPVTDASQRLLGVIRDRDEFEFLFRAILPVISSASQLWLPFPSTDSFQKVEVISIEVPGKYIVLNERENDNRLLFMNVGPESSEATIEIRYRVERREKAAYEEKVTDWKKFLLPDRLVPATENFKEIAEKVVAGKLDPLVRARALYDHVIDRMRYMKFGTGWGKGDAVYACDIQTGNCSDFHSYFIALARAVGIPARFAIGAAIPSERNEGGIDGYHCWAEFFAHNKWWPVDISEGDKYTSLATFYFGHHPANRFELSHGRDFKVEPGPTSGPINFLAYPVLEIAGKPAQTKVEFSFKRIVPGK